MVLEAGDFVLIPAAPGFVMSSATPPGPAHVEPAPAVQPDGEVRHGSPDGAPEVRSLIGYCEFGSPDASLLVSLLPRVVRVRGESRLATLLQLVGDEARARRPARDVILERLLEVLLIEALRSSAGTAASPGLLRGLADDRVAAALRCMHGNPARRWTVLLLAREAAMSRSAFFERFRRAVGVAPIEYLLAWRMALAKNMLRRKAATIAEVAERIGYGSPSAFSIAFTRHVGQPPAAYGREQALDRSER